MTPRIAIYYESRLGRNDGNPLYVWRSLKRMQEKKILEVDHLAPTGDMSLFGTYDLHFWVDWGEDALKGVLPYEPQFPGHPFIYWASDTHLGYDYRLAMGAKSDICFVAQKRAVEEFARDGVSAIWLPHAFEPEAYPKMNFATKKYDVCFIGHINAENRIDHLDTLFKEFPNFFYGQRKFEEAASIFGQSKIVFNISIKDDLNMRVFETLGTGSFLLTNDLPTVHEFFKDGVHLVTYKDKADMIEKAKYYLSHDAEREAIAKAGHEEVMKNHTIDCRVQKMLEHSKQFLKEEVHV